MVRRDDGSMRKDRLLAEVILGLDRVGCGWRRRRKLVKVEFVWHCVSYADEWLVIDREATLYGLDCRSEDFMVW